MTTKKLISDIKNALHPSLSETERASKIIPEKYERFVDLLELLQKIRKKYKLEIINNGNSIALKFWMEVIWWNKEANKNDLLRRFQETISSFE